MSASYRSSCGQYRALAKIWSGRDEPEREPEPARDPRFAGVRVPAPMPTRAQLIYLREREKDEAVRKAHLYCPPVVEPDWIEHAPVKATPEYTADELVFDHFQSRNHPKLQPKHKAKTGPGLYVHKPCPAQKAVTKHQHRLATTKANNF